ncbi:hypothetical protein QWY96_07165 [Vibrio artabrorum]|uniref:Uncharacterized protein n=1 Tax=Vibrio artabrorum TaxID=446374 RepID=A0ABT8CGZ0_9VIBR|nr:hypothetical protein [Vibrio artabrorum]MDN3700728.1 hypothetical protein [Vibrio artabrorum]
MFSEDVWPFKESDFKGKATTNLIFSINLEQDDNVIILHQNERNLVNQMKCMALAEMWFSGKNIQLDSIKNKIVILRNNIAQLIRRGITSFEELNQERLEILVDEGCFDMSKSDVFKGLNSFLSLKVLLPFKVNFSHLSHKLFNEKTEDPEGRLVIPLEFIFRR